MSIGTVIPDLDNTLSPEEVRRKTFEEKYATAFNKDQREILDALIGGVSPVSWTQKVTEGVNIADITVDGEITPVYAPEGGADQVQSDWSVSDASSAAFIKNKPTIPAAQIQADWNQTNSSSKDFIKNKPTIPATSSLSRNLLFMGDIDYRAIMRATSYSNAAYLAGFLDTFIFNSSNYTTKTPSTLYLCLPHYGDGRILKSVSRSYNSSEEEVRYVFNTLEDESSRACTVVIPSNSNLGCIYFASTFKDVYSLCAFSNYESLVCILDDTSSSNLGAYSVAHHSDIADLHALGTFGENLLNYNSGVKNTIMLFYEM